MKSLLPQGAYAPHVHPRLRKRLARCTLDCGSKTSESPALRGFVGGPRALATAALYLAFFFVLEKGSKSAGDAVIPTYPMHWSYGLQHLRHKRLTFASADKSGYTLGSLRKIAHKGSHAETGVFRTGVVSLPSERSTRFGNPAWPGFKTAYFAAFGSWSDVLLKNAESLGTAMRSCVSLFRGVAAPLGCVIFFYFCQNCDFYALRTQGLSVCARRGWYHYPRCALCAVETLGARLSK